MPEAGAFSAAEMVDIAIQLEQNGQVFYLEAAKRAAEEDARRLLELLAREEKRHEGIFRQMLPEEKEHRPLEEYPGEKSEYVQALLEERLLPSQEIVDKTLSLLADQDLLDFALGFEKDTILFYYEMRHLLGEAQRPIMEDIMAQEKTHVERLLRLCRRCRR
jgi:rubrerythrin